ncbi:FtsH protease activity modulator HflK [Halioxenophilus aromaticivorans]|uniref:Protein HflK n=1 Tax=Halioxenophilus aromaticivorans TaxID=1306992 RepID=A0AAV3U0F9_9ALTE
MAWNEPGGNNQDPWGGKKGGDGPPDLDEALKSFQDKIGKIFGSSKGGGSGSGGASMGRLPIGILLVVLLVVYFVAGFYKVNEQERAVILRLGVYKETKSSGLHWNPAFIDEVIQENVTRKRFHSTQGTMLTEDLNIVDITLSVQYIISDARDFVLNVKEPEVSLRQATDSALRHVVGSNVMHEVLTEGRAAIAVDVQQRLQQYLDAYTTGILVDTVNIENSAPPREVQAAFDDVNKAREDEERVKNEAQTYANGIIPEARGRAQRTIEEANAYRDRVVAQSEGEAKRFEQLLTEYSKAPEVTRERLYLDAIQDVMANTSKVMVDVEGGNNMMYLPLDKIVERSQANLGGNRVELSQQVIDQLVDRTTEQVRREIMSSSRNTTRSPR